MSLPQLAIIYTDNVQKMDERIKEANKGLVDKTFGAIAGIIQTIIELKNKLMSILAKAGDVIGTIISAPITFLGNLISALTQGFNNFVGNIKKYLISGLINWLTGSLGSTGITLPEKFDPVGIFSLVLQILGLGWDFLRKKAVKLPGEPVVKAMETGLEMFRILKEGGPGALWSYVKDQFSNLKEMVMGEIQNMIITEVIKATLAAPSRLRRMKCPQNPANHRIQVRKKIGGFGIRDTVKHKQKSKSSGTEKIIRQKSNTPRGRKKVSIPPKKRVSSRNRHPFFSLMRSPPRHHNNRRASLISSEAEVESGKLF